MSLHQGVSCFFDGISMAKSRQVRPYIMLPAAVSFLIISSGLYFGLGYLSDAARSMSTSLPDWLSFLDVILTPLIYIVGILAGTWMFGFLATIIGSPFLGELAKAVEDPQELAEQSWASSIWSALARELRKLRYHLPRLLALLLLGFVPVLNAIAPFLWVLFGAWLMAVQFCDFSTENNQRDFEHTLNTLRQHRFKALGFGACVTLAMSIPLLNFIIGPIAATGGTLLMMRLNGNSGTVR